VSDLWFRAVVIVCRAKRDDQCALQTDASLLSDAFDGTRQSIATRVFILHARRPNHSHFHGPPPSLLHHHYHTLTLLAVTIDHLHMTQPVMDDSSPEDLIMDDSTDEKIVIDDSSPGITTDEEKAQLLVNVPAISLDVFCMCQRVSVHDG